MLDTVLNLGLNDESVEGLAARTGNERFAWDSYRRFVQMYGNVVMGIEGKRFEDLIAAEKRERGVRDDTELGPDSLRALTARFQELYDFPADPTAQLRTAIGAVFDSWTGDRAVTYRRINRIPDSWGTAVNVQQMVFGNKGDTSGSGVAFSRDEVTGAPEPSGDFLPNAQGEDVVSGVRTPRDIRELADWQPEVNAQLLDILRTLERHYGDMQDTEFTVEEGRLYMLQTRNAKRPAQAAVRFAVDAVGEGLLDREAALMTIDAEALDALLHPTFDAETTYEILATGVAASPGRGERRARLLRRGRDRGRRRGPRRDPRPPLHRGRRHRRLPRRGRHPHLGGRQGLARGAGRPRHGRPGGDRRRIAGDRPRRGRGPPRRRGRPAGRGPGGDRRLRRRGDRRRRAAGRAGDERRLHHRARLVRRARAGSASAPTPTRPRTLAKPASSAPKGSASAAPSTCSSAPSATRRSSR